MGDQAPESERRDPDAELHAAIIAGEEEAVAEFEERYRRQFIGHGRARGLSPEDAEDAWQEVFSHSIHEARRLAPLGEGLRRYAWGTMRNLVADYQRERSGAPASLDEATAAGQDPEPTRAAPSDQRIRDAVRRCLETLTQINRAILEALFSEGVPPHVAAERLGIPRNTVYKRKTRALEQIRPCLEEALDAR